MSEPIEILHLTHLKCEFLLNFFKSLNLKLLTNSSSGSEAGRCRFEWPLWIIPSKSRSSSTRATTSSSMRDTNNVSVMTNSSVRCTGRVSVDGCRSNTMRYSGEGGKDDN